MSDDVGAPEAPHVITGFARARDGQDERLKAGLLELARRSAAEPGCLDYRVHQDREDRRNLFFYESWRSAEDLHRHLDQAYLAAFLAELPALLDGEVDLRQFRLAR